MSSTIKGYITEANINNKKINTLSPEDWIYQKVKTFAQRTNNTQFHNVGDSLFKKTLLKFYHKLISANLIENPYIKPQHVFDLMDVNETLTKISPKDGINIAKINEIFSKENIPIASIDEIPKYYESYKKKYLKNNNNKGRDFDKA